MRDLLQKLKGPPSKREQGTQTVEADTPISASPMLLAATVENLGADAAAEFVGGISDIDDQNLERIASARPRLFAEFAIAFYCLAIRLMVHYAAEDEIFRDEETKQLYIYLVVSCLRRFMSESGQMDVPDEDAEAAAEIYFSKEPELKTFLANYSDYYGFFSDERIKQAQEVWTDSLAIRLAVRANFILGLDKPKNQHIIWLMAYYRLSYTVLYACDLLKRMHPVFPDANKIEEDERQALEFRANLKQKSQQRGHAV